MCDDGGHVCPKVAHIFKNCRFHQCVNDMLCQIPDLLCKIRKRKKPVLYENPFGRKEFTLCKKTEGI